MGIFSRKVMGGEPVLSSLLITFGQSIDAVETGNQVEAPVAWDLFINAAGAFADSGLLSEYALEAVVSSAKFKIGRELVLNLLELRSFGHESSAFVEKFQRRLEMEFPLNHSMRGKFIPPKDFADALVSCAKSQYSTFGDNQADQVFYAIIGIYFATVYSDSDDDKNSQRVFRRVTAINLGLQLFSQWNIAKRLIG